MPPPPTPRSPDLDKFHKFSDIDLFYKRRMKWISMFLFGFPYHFYKHVLSSSKPVKTK